MKSNLVASCLVVSAMLASGAAMAAPWYWTGTLASWQAAGTVVDADGDLGFTFSSLTTVPDGSAGSAFVTLSEVEAGGLDHYDVGISWDPSTGYPGGYAGVGKLAYSVTVIASSELLATAQLSIAQTGIVDPQVKTEIYDVPGGTLLASLGVPPSPASAQLAGLSSIFVQDTVPAQSGGVLQDMHNSFTTAVPEPGSISMVLAGLAGLGLIARRRRTRS